MAHSATGGSSASQSSLTRLGYCGAVGSFLGSSAIVGLSTTITMWQAGLGLDATQVGALSAALNFAIAAGSLLAGWLCARLGMTRVFNWVNLVSVIGFVLCAAAPDFWMLLAGVVLAGLGTGLDLPVSISVMSRDTQDPAAGSTLVTVTQLGWQVGMLGSALAAFAVSGFAGATGGRVVFVLFAAIACGLLLWRLRSSEFAALHAAGERTGTVGATGADAPEHEDAAVVDAGVVGTGPFGIPLRLVPAFASLLVFYIGWNLVANTWGQFQTYMLVNAHASQSLATGLGIVLYIVMFAANWVVSVTVNTRWRNPLFVAGGVIAFGAMILMAAGGGSLWVIVAATAIMYVGLPLAGEAICKVWTQETFPATSRAAVQGFILGFSRLLCGLFAFVTPALVLPATIGTTLWGFVAVVAVFVAAGCTFMRVRRVAA
ncbi:sugar transporter [Bifidobacterium ramosum]|uniref:MFS transporter n=1 Tax=Bifidobacterium ramosum TaxID=1798158 RepID=A0A6L4WXB4_9BIFI|nr:MFS transporter [Bifidobacterium ramosum]KAB8286634.1 sugar transporter [Bifidobacterium ramosum]NEG72815.1 MFS transporter [Bifidobacterium ramosum]